MWAGRIPTAGRALLRWALYQAALGAARTPAGRAWLDALRAKRAGDRFAFCTAVVELAAKLLRIVWGVWRSGRPCDPPRALGTPPPAGAEARRPRSGSLSWPGRTGCGSPSGRRRQSGRQHTPPAAQGSGSASATWRRPGRPRRDPGAPLSLPEPGHGRLGASGSDDLGWPTTMGRGSRWAGAALPRAAGSSPHAHADGHRRILP